VAAKILPIELDRLAGHDRSEDHCKKVGKTGERGCELNGQFVWRHNMNVAALQNLAGLRHVSGPVKSFLEQSSLTAEGARIQDAREAVSNILGYYRSPSATRKTRVIVKGGSRP
jgi:hypothetical protein